MIQTFNDITKIRLGTALVSLLLSFFAFYTNDIINRDGILYLAMSKAYLDGGLLAPTNYEQDSEGIVSLVLDNPQRKKESASPNE